MTKYIYVSTNPVEAEDIAGYIMAAEEWFWEVGIDAGEEIKDRVGFNPISYAALPDSIKDSRIDKVVNTLVENGLFVTVVRNGHTEQLRPGDYEAREQAVMQALQTPSFDTFVSHLTYGNKLSKYD